MCLITHWKKPKRAKHDIICYKIVYYISDTTVEAFMQPYNYILGTVYTEFDPFKDLNNEEVTVWDTIAKEAYNIPGLYRITRPDIIERNLKIINTGFHSFEKLDRAKNSKDVIYNRYSMYRHVIVRCTIPKDSLYYKSKDGQIVSNKIIINNVI